MMANKITVNIQKLTHGQDLPLPCYATELSAGVDLLTASADDLVLKPQQRMLVPTGIAIELPPGFEAQIRPRSGLANKHGVTVLNSPGTIDADYRGEICVILINHGDQDFTITRGMRIAQMVVAKVSIVNWNAVNDLSASKRGADGFGSTGSHAPAAKDQ